MKLYGRSDVLAMNIVLPSGQKVKIDFGKTDDEGNVIAREDAPGYGDDNRSMPFVETDDPELIAFLRKDGWQTSPSHEALLTVDEVEARERATREGSVQANLMAKEMGAVLAQIIANQKATATSSSK